MPTGQRITVNTGQKIIRRRAAGKTWDEIAKEFGLSSQGARTWGKRHKVDDTIAIMQEKALLESQRTVALKLAPGMSEYQEMLSSLLALAAEGLRKALADNKVGTSDDMLKLDKMLRLETERPTENMGIENRPFAHFTPEQMEEIIARSKRKPTDDIKKPSRITGGNGNGNGSI